MSPLRPAWRPRRPLARLATDVAVIATGAVGYLDAAEEARRRWAVGFRRLLDGLEFQIQVMIASTPGYEVEDDEHPFGEMLPAPETRRAMDLAFAERLCASRSAQRREVWLVVRGSAADGLERALRWLGVPDVRRVEWRPPAGTLVGVEMPDALEDETGWHRTWYMERFPGGELWPGWLLRLIPPGRRITLSWHAERLPTDWVTGYLQRQLVRMRATQLHRADGIGDVQVDRAVVAAASLQRRLSASQESAFHVSVYLTATAASRAELEAAAGEVEAAARSALCTLLPCTFRQLDGRLATLPLGRDPLARRRLLDTTSLVTLFPWFDADLQDARGLVVGRSRATGQPVLVDPFDDARYTNANVGVFGHSGAGKTYLLSTLTMGARGSAPRCS